MDNFAIQTVNFDYYMQRSYRTQGFIEKSDTNVPIIRIFGSTHHGQRILAHVHGILPYMYFRPAYVNDTSFDSKHQVLTYLKILHDRIEDQFESKRIAAKSAKHENGVQTEIKPKRHIHHLEVEEKLPLYGYWGSEKIFIKCYFFDPSDAKNLISILESGSLGAVMQPYEGHIPFLLQFTSDFNIQPMNWLYIEPNFKFRLPLAPDVPLFPPPSPLKVNTVKFLEKYLSLNSDLPVNGNQVIPPDLYDTPESDVVSSSLLTKNTIPASKVWPTNPYNTSYAIGNILSSSSSSSSSSSNVGIESTEKLGDYSLPGIIANSSIPVTDGVHAVPATPVRSVCELEIDLHACHILNLHMSKGKFGAELWEEESNRRKRRGLDPQTFPTPPYTCSRHLPLSETEKDFQQRLKNLMMKGKAMVDTESSRALLRMSSLSQSPFPKNLNLSQPYASISPSLLKSSNPDSDNLGIIGVYDTIDSIDSSPLVQSWLQQVDNQEVADITYGNMLSQAFQIKELPIELSQHVSLNDFPDNDENDIQSDSESSDNESIGENDSEPPTRLKPAKHEHHQQVVHKDIEDILSSTQDSDKIIEQRDVPITPQPIATLNRVPSPILAESLSSSNNPMKRKAKMSSAFDTKRRKKVMFADEVSIQEDKSTILGVSSPSSSSIISVALDHDSNNISKQQSPVYYSPPSDELMPYNTQGSPVYVNDMSRPTLILIPTTRPPSRAELKDMSYYNQSSQINQQVHVSSIIDISSAHVSSKTPQQAVLNRRRDIIKYFGDLPMFDGGYIPANMVASHPLGSGTMNQPRRDYSNLHVAASDVNLNHNLGVMIRTQDSGEEDADRNVILEIDAIDELAWQQSTHQQLYMNISSEQCHYLSIRYDGALDSIKEILSVIEGDPILISPASKMVTRYLTPAFKPPTASQLHIILSSNHSFAAGSTPKKSTYHKSNQRQRRLNYKKSQIATPSPTNPASFSNQGKSFVMALPNDPVSSSSDMKKSRLTIISIEIYCRTRKDLLPNPKHDPVHMISWCVHDTMTNSESEDKQILHGIFSVYQSQDMHHDTIIDEVALADKIAKDKKIQKILMKASGLTPGTIYDLVDDEQALFLHFIRLIRYIDPDIMIGYEVQNSSLGYVITRAKTLGIDMLQQLSRVPSEKSSNRNEHDEYASEHESGIFITGRMIFNIWRRLRSELKLMSYTRQNVAEQLLQAKLPSYSNDQLTRWYRETKHRSKTVQYFHLLAEVNLLFLDKLDLIYRLSESARLYGIDLFSVISRGSQYRVEASLLTKAHLLNYIMISPSRRQVANQAAMACIPLVMEPHPSKYYHDPIIVLDFQSLYPSMIMAYNLCYSTCLGKLQPGQNHHIIAPDTTNRLGVIDYPEKLSAKAIHHQSSMLSSEPHITPNGSIFCSKNVREGILPMMLREILNTRIMTKKAMKEYASDDDRVLRRVLDARQLAIKLLANVTYGYTAAGFSGRMPMAELADAIVQSGRSTLNWTINEIEINPTWRATVVYGDTDSVFVSVPGRSKAEAFKIGRDIADFITSKSPADVVLKFEKVYESSILVTKKRYVGSSYESEDQLLPHLDAKGIECIRRDQCPITMKIQESCLRILFRSRDLSQVKAYLCDEWKKILQGGDKLPLKDFIFRKEVKYGKYHPSSLPPGAVLVSKALTRDDMAVPPYRWKVPYIVIAGLPKSLLCELIITPEEILSRGNTYRINSTYYVEKCINPALVRVLSLCGADVTSWYRQLSKPKLRRRHICYDTYTSNHNNSNNNITSTSSILQPYHNANPKMKQTSMDTFTYQNDCEVCSTADAMPKKDICKSCYDNKCESSIILYNRLNIAVEADRAYQHLCHNCTHTSHGSHAALFQRGEMISCDSCRSIDCAIFFERCRIIPRIEDYHTVLQDLD